jgi:hypothetical protein
MATYRAQISFQLDSALPRDAVTISPHFIGDDPQGLADRLGSNLLAHANVGATVPLSVKIYDAKKAPPSYPLAIHQQGTGSKATGLPRELALCLSYYAQWNRPTFRGRLYLPLALLAVAAIGLRPSLQHMQSALDFRTIFTSGMPAGTYWVVYSRTTGQASQVTDVWVDDEWDIQRSRGLEGTDRQIAAIP